MPRIRNATHGRALVPSFVSLSTKQISLPCERVITGRVAKA